MVNGGGAGRHAVGDVGGQLNLTAIAVHAADVTVFDAASLSVDTEIHTAWR